jgi:hypothetical protein
MCCGAGASEAATFCWSRSRSFFYPALAPGMKVLIKCYKNPKFFILKFVGDFKNHNFLALYFKQPFYDHLCLFKKHENFLKTMKIVEFFLIIWGQSQSRNF